MFDSQPVGDSGKGVICLSQAVMQEKPFSKTLNEYNKLKSNMFIVTKLRFTEAVSGYLNWYV